MAKRSDKKKILKAARGKKIVPYEGNPRRQSADFLPETLQARREWHHIHKMMKERKKKNNLQPRILYPTRLSFRIEEGIKSFPNKS